MSVAIMIVCTWLLYSGTTQWPAWPAPAAIGCWLGALAALASSDSYTLTDNNISPPTYAALTPAGGYRSSVRYSALAVMDIV